MPREHILKTEIRQWDAVAAGIKPFEVRYDGDRHFAVGDRLLLVKWDRHTGKYVAEDSDPDAVQTLIARIGFILHGGQYGIAPGYAVLALTGIARLMPPPVSTDARGAS